MALRSDTAEGFRNLQFYENMIKRLEWPCVPPSAWDVAGFSRFNPVEECHRCAISLRVSEWGPLVNEALLNFSCISMSLGSREVVAHAETLEPKVTTRVVSIRDRPMPL